MSDITLFNKEGKILASSREVAEKFGKRNPDVNRAVENLIVQNCTVKNMFIKTSYTSRRGRNETEYLMDRDGFSLLVMGFTGAKALEWKLKYIKAFNEMEERLKADRSLSEKEKLKLQLFSKDPLEVVSAHKRLVELEVDKATAPLIPKAEYHDEVLNKDGLITTTVIAKDLGFKSATKLNQILNLNHILFKNQSGTWCPYAEYEWLITENYADYQSYGAEKSKPCLKWTERGRKWITQNYNKWVQNLIK
jgi:phage regulatory protein, rha family